MAIGPMTEVILYVSDMERAVRFYRDTLGFAAISPVLDDYGDQFWVVLDTGGCKLCLHGGASSGPRRDSAKIVFRVDDIHAAREHLLAQGVKMDAVFSPAPEVLVSNSFDPDGNPFSIESQASSTV